VTLVDLLTSEDYRDYVRALAANLPSQPFDLDAPAEPVIVSLHETWLGHAGTTATALRDLMGAERLQTFQYIGQKLAAFTEPDGGPDNIVNEPANLHTPIGHLIEYLIHRRNAADLPGYLKKIRMPQARAYAATTARMFRAASDSGA